MFPDRASGVPGPQRTGVRREEDEARVQLTEEVGNGPCAAVDGVVLEAKGLGFGGEGSWC